LLKGFVKKVGADGLQVVAEQVAEVEALVAFQVLLAFEQEPAQSQFVSDDGEEALKRLDRSFFPHPEQACNQTRQLRMDANANANVSGFYAAA